MGTRSLCLLTLLAALTTGCAPGPIRQGHVDARWLPSPNFDERRPNYIILHQTTNTSVDTALATLTNRQRKVSAHYLISRDGDILQLVDEQHRAWHAGRSWWGGTTDLNSSSIGIELDNTGMEPFSEPMIAALISLLDDLRQRYRIPSANVLGHGDIAPRRKVDPSPLFPWSRLAERGHGLWCNTALPDMPMPERFDPDWGLQSLGYDITSVTAVRSAFRRHFLGHESDSVLSTEEQQLLWCLLKQKTAGLD